MIPEIRKPKNRKLSFPTELLSSLFSVWSFPREHWLITATRRKRKIRELCLFGSLSTIQLHLWHSSLALCPVGKRDSGLQFYKGLSLVMTESTSSVFFFNTCSTTLPRGLPFSVLSLIPDILVLNFYLKIKQRPRPLSLRMNPS